MSVGKDAASDLIRGAICWASDVGHDALLRVYPRRYNEQIEIANAEEILRRWTSAQGIG